LFVPTLQRWNGESGHFPRGIRKWVTKRERRNRADERVRRLLVPTLQRWNGEPGHFPKGR
jgi:hypothetical protein